MAPGLTETEGVLASPHKEAFDFIQMLQCIPRRGVAADIAPAVEFLASEEAGWVTGQLLVADGGMSHTRHLEVAEATMDRRTLIVRSATALAAAGVARTCLAGRRARGRSEPWPLQATRSFRP